MGSCVLPLCRSCCASIWSGRQRSGRNRRCSAAFWARHDEKVVARQESCAKCKALSTFCTRRARQVDGHFGRAHHILLPIRRRSAMAQIWAFRIAAAVDLGHEARQVTTAPASVMLMRARAIVTEPRQHSLLASTLTSPARLFLPFHFFPVVHFFWLVRQLSHV